MKIRLLKYVDKIFSTLLTRFLTTPRPRPLLTPERILIIRPGGIGDAVHLIPAIKTLKKNFPETIIDVLAEKRNGKVFSLSHDVARVIHYDKLPELLKVFTGRYDVVIDTEQWHYLSAVIARLSGAAKIIGYATNERKKLFTHPVHYSHGDYEVDSFKNLLAPFNLKMEADSTPPYLTVPISAVQKADQLLAILAKKPFIALFPGASIPERRWGMNNFMALAECLYEKGFPFVVIGGSNDAADGERIAGRGHGLNLSGKTSLVETAALVDRSAVLISGDTGILHIGVGLGKATVSLFGPGIADKWAPRGEPHVILNKRLPCSPCTKFGYTLQCPINAKCMSDISVDEVLQGVERLMRITATKMDEVGLIKTSKQIP